MAAKKRKTATKAAAKKEGAPMKAQLACVTADGMHAVMTQGRGDCMYHAISDQLYGHQNAHVEIRARTAAFLRQHRAVYIDWVPADPMAENLRGTRSTQSAAKQKLPPAPTEAERNRAFDLYVERKVERRGTWGGDMELQALCGAYLVDIRVYQEHGPLLTHQPLVDVLPEGHRPEERKLLRVAYYVRRGPLRFRATNRGRRPGVEEAEAEADPEAQGAAPRSPSHASSPPVLREPEERPQKKRVTFAALPPSSPPVLDRPAPALAPAAATSPAALASDDKRRPVTVRLSGIPGGAAVISGLVKCHLAVTWAGEALAGPLPAVPASDDPYRLVKVRLTGIPGGDVVLSGLVNGQMTIFRAGGVLAVGGVAEAG
ncbi:MAG: hypothetical protein M1826_005674 [Phylliscum demangeonii]|nr:MAG: hypothetical protein M1826_005674 [Phylliscum demangeonii]